MVTLKENISWLIDVSVQFASGGSINFYVVVDLDAIQYHRHFVPNHGCLCGLVEERLGAPAGPGLRGVRLIDPGHTARLDGGINLHAYLPTLMRR